MAAARLEHANITVSDPDRSADFLAKLCGWHERWRGPSQLGGWTIHLGSDTEYLALYSPDAYDAKLAEERVSKPQAIRNASFGSDT